MLDSFQKLVYIQSMEETNVEYKEFMDLEEVAKYIGVSMSTVYRYIHDEENPLPSFKITKRKIVVKKAELDEWIEGFRKNGN